MYAASLESEGFGCLQVYWSLKKKKNLKKKQKKKKTEKPNHFATLFEAASMLCVVSDGFQLSEVPPWRGGENPSSGRACPVFKQIYWYKTGP